MAGSEMVLVILNDGNLGAHRIVGASTKTDYGYRSHGDEFLVHRSDYAAFSHKMVLKETVMAAPVLPTRGEIIREQDAQVVTLDANRYVNVKDIPGLTKREVLVLENAGITTALAIVQAGVEGIEALEAIGPKTALKIVSGAREVLAISLN